MLSGVHLEKHSMLKSLASGSHHLSKYSSSRSFVQLSSSTARRRSMSMEAPATADPTNSFISQFTIEGSSSGPLAGLTLAVKDLYDIAGHPTAFGSPKWLETHPVATETSPPVLQLLAAGATVVGKTHMDELAYSLNGENAHYGTPVNVAAPGRVPGGSSAGSVAAVAAGQADIALGSDTGGSVRVPASYCGICGFRPTHGRVSLEHARPLADSYDTVGWFTREAALLRKVGQILLSSSAAPKSQTSSSQQQKPRWLVGKDAFSLALPETTKAIYDALGGDKYAAVTAVLGTPTEIDVAAGLESEGLGKLELWMDVFRITQGYEVWQAHGAWVSSHKPDFGPGILERFKMASNITADEFKAADAKRQLIKQHMEQLLESDGLLALPSAPGPAVELNTPADKLDSWRKSLLSLTCIAGLAGLPQVSLPLAQVDGLPVGFSLIGPPGSDEWLLDVAVQLTAATGNSDSSNKAS